MMPAATLKHLSLLSPPPLRSFPPISSLLLSSSSSSSSSSWYLRPPSLPSLRSVPHPPLQLALMSAFTTPPPPPGVSSSLSSSSACFCFRADRERPPDAPAADADGDEDDDDEDEGDLAFHVRDGCTSTSPSSAVPDRLDVLGLGQAMVDFSGMVDDAFLERLGLLKGTRKLVNHEERGRVLRAMDGCSYKAAAGGSLSNSLVALSRLGTRPFGGPPLNIAMAGSVGSDPLGGFYRAKLRRANVNFLSAPVTDGTTGTVIVLTTPDAQRTMLAYQVRHDSSGSPSTTSKNNMIAVATLADAFAQFDG